MEKLNSNWITEGLIDFEYKKYLLLAYLQYVNKHFDKQKLYPCLSDLIDHYRQLTMLKSATNKVQEQFPKKISKIDVQNLQIAYEKLFDNDDYMRHIEDILAYAIPKIQQEISIGQNIYETVEDKINIEAVGIVPLHKQEGYLLVNNGQQSDTHIFTFNFSIFTHAQHKYRSLKTKYIDKYIRKISHTNRFIKLDLIKKRKELPNPATYAVYINHKVPLHETLIPVTKRKILQLIIY